MPWLEHRLEARVGCQAMVRLRAAATISVEQHELATVIVAEEGGDGLLGEGFALAGE
jgi:hypothetical protein